MFSDLKRGLEKISEDEWDAIPEIGDRSIAKRTKDKFTPVPDSLLLQAQNEMVCHWCRSTAACLPHCFTVCVLAH
jgi:hypothetical protein